MRLFLALPLAEPLRARLMRAQQELEGLDWQLRLPPPEQLHLTLQFLGETPDNLLEDLRHDLGAWAHARRPFDLSCGGIGAFPDWRDPRVVWAGIADASGKLRELFDSSLRILKGYRIWELRAEFQPHLTLARVRELKAGWDGRRVEALRAQWENLGTLPVERVELYRSRPGAGGVEHELLQTYDLNRS